MRDPSVIHGGRGRTEARSGRADALIDNIKDATDDSTEWIEGC